MQLDFSRIEARLDRIEHKLDSHLDRVSKNEADIVWIKGHVKIVTVLAVAVLSAIVLTALGLK